MLKPSKKTLLAEYENKEIKTCEIRIPGCFNNWLLAFAHRHKRRWYKTKPELLWTLNQTILACQYCHNEIEYDKEKTKEVFKKLRGEEKG